jgi:hypothetical protein
MQQVEKHIPIENEKEKNVHLVRAIKVKIMAKLPQKGSCISREMF